MAAVLNDFVLVFRRIFRAARWLGLAFLVVTLVLFVREAAAVFDVLGGADSPLAWMFAAVAIGLSLWLLGGPVYRFLRVPVVVAPPCLPERDEPWRDADLRRRTAFLLRYLRGLRRNPLLRDAGAGIAAAAEDLRALERRIAAAPDPAAARAILGAFERDRVDALLAPLDREADRLIRAEALSVGLATALSPNGTLDAFLVLWRNANLVSRLANVYYGRPGVRGSLRILSDVSTAALLASYLEGLADAAGGVLRGFVGSVVGTVAAPVIDGTINAVATLRIGYLAKARCRSFAAWTDRTRTQALADAFAAAKARSKDVIAELAKSAGHGIAGLPGKLADAVKGGFSAILRHFRAEGEEPAAPDAAPGV